MELVKPEFVSRDNRRTLSQILTADLKQVNFYEAKKGAVLGNHYHKATQEYFFIVKGTVNIGTRRPNSNITSARIFNKGDMFVVFPQEVHIIECMTDVAMLTFLTKPYTNDNPDIYKETD